VDATLIELAERQSRRFYLAGGDADDARQEALIAAWDATQRWDPAGGLELEQFVAFCVRRRLVTALKLTQRHKHRPLTESLRAIANEDGELEPIAELIPDRRADVVELAEQRDRLRRLAAAWPSLSELERATLEDVVNGRQPATASKSVGNALERARAKLRSAAA